MNLITEEQRILLLQNGRFNSIRRDRGEFEIDHKPVVKLFTPRGGATWLLSEFYPNDTDVAFGLCDLGFGFPELGCVRLSELEGLTDLFGPAVERDLHFVAVKSLREYAADAWRNKRIIA